MQSPLAWRQYVITTILNTQCRQSISGLVFLVSFSSFFLSLSLSLSLSVPLPHPPPDVIPSLRMIQLLVLLIQHFIVHLMHTKLKM